MGCVLRERAFWDSGLKLMNGFNEGDGNLVSCCQRMDLRTW